MHGEQESAEDEVEVSRIVPRSIQNLDSEKEIRMNEALKKKDEQIRFLTEQNKELTASLDYSEEELRMLKLEKAAVEADNKTIREDNIQLQSNATCAAGELDDFKSGHEDMESQLLVSMRRSAELLKLLEVEEANMADIQAQFDKCKKESMALEQKYQALVGLSSEANQNAKSAARENKLKAEEIRVLRLEVEGLRQKNSELTRKNTIDLSDAQEQLSLSKQNRYELLEKLEKQAHTSRLAEDQLKELEQSLHDLRLKSSDLETQLRLESNARISQDEINRDLVDKLKAASEEKEKLALDLKTSDEQCKKWQDEAYKRAQGIQELSQSVFETKERLAQCERASKTSSKELSKKEQECFSLKKKLSKAIDDITEERRKREKMEAEKRGSDDQLRVVKQSLNQLGNKLKEEAKARIQAEDSLKVETEKKQTLEVRCGTVVNMMETHCVTISTQKEELKNKESQICSLSQRNNALQSQLAHEKENNKTVTMDLKDLQKSLNEMRIKFEALTEKTKIQEEQAVNRELNDLQSKGRKSDSHLAGGQLRFFVDSKRSLGQILIKGKCSKDKAWIEEKGCNSFLRKALKGQNPQEVLVQRIAELYGMILLSEEKLESSTEEIKSKNENIDLIDRELNKMHSCVVKEEESKLRILRNYIRVVKESASLGKLGSAEDGKKAGEVRVGGIYLPEVCLRMRIIFFSSLTMET